MNTKIVVGVVVAVALLLVGVVAVKSGYVSFGAVVTGPIHQQLEQFRRGIVVGDRFATQYELIASGTCTLQANASHTATTTKATSCTGITGYTGVARDIVRLQLAASTTLASQYVIKSAYASTTATGAVEALLVNLTGGTAVPAATNGFGSSTVYQIWRPYP